MTFGKKTDGPSFSIGRWGFSFFVPGTRWSYSFWGGAGLRLFNPEANSLRPGFRPFVMIGRANSCKDEPAKIFTRMWHLRHPYNVIRIGAL